MEIAVKKNLKLGGKELFIDSKKVGVLEVIDCKIGYTFISTCPHENLSGDHYILIGNKLNEINSTLNLVK